MEAKLREYIENIFSKAPNTLKAVELKEEILQNLIDKYNDLLSDGKTELAAYNIAVASIGDVDELIAELRRGDHTAQAASDANIEEFAKSKQRSALLTAISIALYILCVIPPIIFEDDIIGPSIMFVMIAAATGLIIYSNMTKKKYIKKDDTIVENFKEWNERDNQNRQLVKAVSAALWSVIVAVYLLISFITGAWYITWVIFLIGGAAEGIVKAIFDLVKYK